MLFCRNLGGNEMNIRHNIDKDRIYPADLISAIEISNYKNYAC